ncbi:MAG: hypothetical protein NWR11_02120 [Cyanobium sp. MAG_137]|jgi:hypothetical protein|nr:hypothetical protein [Cyanobium sp. MAG_160]MDP4880931.1 hypothetical protein [Cyanobium sp. MAG_137]MDP5123752.1 hypothetical protein [Cyanobium sp. MAG_04]CAK6696876.1 hypothetical protein OGCDGJMD_02137 [Cyanobium usitatum str. Tous]
MDLQDKDYLKVECTQINQNSEEAQPAINMMIDTWVHMVQAGRLPIARTTHRTKA